MMKLSVRHVCRDPLLLHVELHACGQLYVAQVIGSGIGRRQWRRCDEVGLCCDGSFHLLQLLVEARRISGGQ
jgi:hypothetical protein